MSRGGSAGFSTSMVSSVQRAVPTSGQTVVIAQTNSLDLNLVLEPAALLLALTVTLPTGTLDGQKCSIMSTAAITALTMNTVSGGLIGNLTSLVLNGYASFVWVSATSTWYRIG